MGDCSAACPSKCLTHTPNEISSASAVSWMETYFLHLHQPCHLHERSTVHDTLCKSSFYPWCFLHQNFPPSPSSPPPMKTFWKLFFLREQMLGLPHANRQICEFAIGREPHTFMYERKSITENISFDANFTSSVFRYCCTLKKMNYLVNLDLRFCCSYFVKCNCLQWCHLGN